MSGSPREEPSEPREELARFFEHEHQRRDSYGKCPLPCGQRRRAEELLRRSPVHGEELQTDHARKRAPTTCGFQRTLH